MTGIQKTLAEALKDLANKVATGAFGTDDDIDAQAFLDDLEDAAGNLAG